MIIASLISLSILCLYAFVAGFPQVAQPELVPQLYGDYFMPQELTDYSENLVEKRAMMRLGKRAMMRLGKRSDDSKHQKRAPFRLG
uniref:Neuropeptide-Like Protein n=1 Tax=Steinernema glaseri TaxID=37863 RepID=A0A1I8A2E1_9BILA